MPLVLGLVLLRPVSQGGPHHRSQELVHRQHLRLLPSHVLRQYLLLLRRLPLVLRHHQSLQRHQHRLASQGHPGRVYQLHGLFQRVRQPLEVLHSQGQLHTVHLNLPHPYKLGHLVFQPHHH